LERLPSVIREAKSKHELIETNRYLINELKRANEKLQQMTFTDEMTGIHNYRFIRKQLEAEVKRASRYGKALSVCVVDIDYFKKINDLHGHSVGDDALREIAHILREQTRTVDIVGRYAGDEFVVIFPDTTLTDAVRLCERIRKRVNDYTFISHGIEMQCSLSIGVADFEPHKRKTPELLLEAADKCLYQAKRSGRNRVGSLLRVLDKSSDSNIVQLNN
jgi:diguanylate cyclase (GGDEF)-like protein